MDKIALDKIEQAVKTILEAVGEDPSREGLLDTPKRVAKMYAELFAGLNDDPAQYSGAPLEREPTNCAIGYSCCCRASHALVW